LVGLLVAGYLIALGWQAWHVGLTFDEPAHMLDAYLYWLGQPDLSPRDFTPLIKILTGWIPRILEIPLFPELPVWKNDWKQDVASEILDRLRPDQIQKLFFLMRLVLIIFPISTALLIWHWGRKLFGRVPALLLLTAVLMPTALAHGCLLKNDLAAAFSYLLCAYCGWRLWLEPGWRTSLLLGGSVLLAMLAKMSLLVTGPMAFLLVVARRIGSPRPRLRWLGLALGAVLLITYLGLLAAYKFDAHPATLEELAEMRAGGVFSEAVTGRTGVFGWIPLPSDLLSGVRSLSLYQEHGAPGYLLGEALSSGRWSYYPLALMVKTPIAVQILFVGGAVLLSARCWRRKAVAADGFLLVPGILYLSLAMQSNLQLGVRLVLPCLPFALLVGGVAIERGLQSPTGRAALTAVLLWMMVASVSIYPQGISYFNEWAGGPGQGWKYLVDSNLDWGQNLPELADYVRRNRLQKLKLYYFGYDKLHRYGIEDRVERLAPPWGPDLVSGTRLVPSPGIYAVSATLLPGHFFDTPYRDYFLYFREREPEAKIGYSIFIYKVD